MAKSIADDLMERRNKVVADAKAIAQKGVTEARDLTVEEQAAFDQLIAEAEAVAKRAQAIREGEQAAHDLEASFRDVTGREKVENADGKLGQWARSAAVGSYIDLLPRFGAEARALERVVKGESRAMSATGGLSSDGVYGQLWEYAVQVSQLLQSGVHIVNTSDGNTLPFPVATVHAQTDNGTDTAIGPNTAITNSDSTLATVNNTVAKHGFLTLVPTELVQDAVFDVEGYIARNAGRQLGLRVARTAALAAIAGYTTVGVTGPTGTATSLGNQATAGQGSDLLIQLFHSVLPMYRSQSSWLLADPTAAILQQLKSGTTGDTIFGSISTMGDGISVMNKPVFVDPNLPSPAANAQTIYYGDWASLIVRVAGGMRFERSTEFAFGSDQTAYRAIVRVGSCVLDPNAVKCFKHSAT